MESGMSSNTTKEENTCIRPQAKVSTTKGMNTLPVMKTLWLRTWHPSFLHQWQK